MLPAIRQQMPGSGSSSNAPISTNAKPSPYQGSSNSGVSKYAQKGMPGGNKFAPMKKYSNQDVAPGMYDPNPQGMSGAQAANKYNAPGGLYKNNSYSMPP